MTPTATYQDKDFIEINFDKRRENESWRNFQRDVFEAGADWKEYYQAYGYKITTFFGSSLVLPVSKTFPSQGRVFVNKASSSQGVLHFKEPLEIVITKTEECFLAWCEEFHVSGNGDTVEEALNDLYAFLVHIFLSYLHTDPSNMSGGATQQFNRFKELLTGYEKFSS